MMSASASSRIHSCSVNSTGAMIGGSIDASGNIAKSCGRRSAATSNSLSPIASDGGEGRVRGERSLWCDVSDVCGATPSPQPSPPNGVWGRGRCMRVARRCAINSSHRTGHAAFARNSALVRNPSPINASCNSSAVRACGHDSSRTAAIASGSSRPKSCVESMSPQRRDNTACVRRSSSGASSRKAYGRALKTSAASGDGAVRSRQTKRTSPLSMRRSSASRPSISIASCRQSCRVCATSG